VRIGEHLVGTRIEADATGATAVPGAWVAGNLADPMAQVVTSAAAGLAVGAAINLDLVTEDASQAVSARRRRLKRAEPAPVAGA
jgi:thioredoxin reductase (NADPH)